MSGVGPDAEEAPSPLAVRHAIDCIVALLHSGAGDLCAIELDTDGIPPFHRRVYELTRTIAPVETVTYGEIAAQLGAAGSARAVGHALARNPFRDRRAMPSGARLPPTASRLPIQPNRAGAWPLVGPVTT